MTLLWTKLYLLLFVDHMIALRGRKGTVLGDGLVWTRAILLLKVTGSFDVKFIYRLPVTEKYYVKSLKNTNIQYKNHWRTQIYNKKSLKNTNIQLKITEEHKYTIKNHWRTQIYNKKSLKNTNIQLKITEEHKYTIKKSWQIFSAWKR